MIGIAVAAILLAVALPNFRSAIQNNRISSQSNELLTAFQLARSESLKRGSPIVVCPSDDSATCSGDWEDGWIVVVDDNNAGESDVDEGEVLRVWGAVSGDLTLTGAGTFYRFLPRGILDDSAGVGIPATVSIEIPGCTGDQARDLEIARSGRTSLRRVACS
jgi:type IV fimbrial biogenesis protein FimT